MTLEIKTASIEPLRHTFDNVARRLGADKPVSRYLEATYDLQATVNFHYRPLWDPDHEIFDTARTVIEMEDWYALRDPRQYYYGTWTIARSRQQEAAERSFSLVEERNLLELAGPEARRLAEAVLVPLRHAEYAANLNNMYVCAYGYGTAITQAASFAAVDRLAIAQYLSRIGLMLDGNSCESLDRGKHAWLEEPAWQPLRRLTEDLMVTRDWFELFVAQNFALDGLAFPLVYTRIDAALQREAGSALSLLTGFMVDWYAETRGWVDSVLKTAAAQSGPNKASIERWARAWRDRAAEALTPVAAQVFGEEAGQVVQQLCGELAGRAKKLGLDIE